MGYFVHPTAIVEDAEIGEGTRIWHFAHIRKGVKIGGDCNIGKDVYIDVEVKIGDRVKIQNGVSVYRGAVIEDDVFVGPAAVFTNDLYPRAFSRDWEAVRTLVRKGASICANATIICGVEIGEFALVGAGAVVTKDVPPFALVYGNPARIRGFVCYCGRKLDEGKIERRMDKIVFRCPFCNKVVEVGKEDYERYLREEVF